MLILLMLLALPVHAITCEKGCTEVEGFCACDAPVEKGQSSVKPSDEKPPRHPQPAWETGEVKAVIIPTAPVKPESEDQGKSIPNGGVPER